MQTLGSLCFALVALAAAVYLYRTYRQWKIKKQVAFALDTDSLPEAGWAKLLTKARNEMAPDDYEKVEKAIYKIVGDINVVNSSGLRTEKERLAMLAQLSRSTQSDEK